MKRCYYCMEELLSDVNICPNCGKNPSDGKNEEYHIAPGTWLEERYLVGISSEYHGNSIIYSGYDKLLQHSVTIKEYYPLEYVVRSPDSEHVLLYVEEFRTPFDEGLNNFIGEAKKLAKFRDVKGIARIFDVFEDNNTAYQIIEAVSGNKLSDYIASKGRLPVSEVIKLLEPVALSLEKVHSEGLIHRNISPETIVIDMEGKAKLIDFGAARRTSNTATKSLSVIIDPGYTPTEQYISSGNQGAWTDVYALAATIYKCITGITPEESVLRSREDTLKSPSEYGVNIDSSIEDAIMHALCPDVTERTLTISDFLYELNNNYDTVSGKKTGGWYMYRVICIVIWVFSMTMSTYLIQDANKRKKEELKSRTDIITTEPYFNEDNTLRDNMPDENMSVITTTENIISTHDTGSQTETKVNVTTDTSEMITEDNTVKENMTENTAEDNNTEGIATKEKVTSKKTIEKKTSEKGKNSKKKKTAEKKNTEKKTEVSDTENSADEVIYIED